MARFIFQAIVIFGFLVNPALAQHKGKPSTITLQNKHGSQQDTRFFDIESERSVKRPRLANMLRKSTVFITTAVVGLSIAFHIAVKPAQAMQTPSNQSQAAYGFVQPKLGTNSYPIEDINQTYFKEMATSLEFKLGRKAYQFVKQDGSSLRMSATERGYLLQELDAQNAVANSTSFSSTSELFLFAKEMFNLPPLADRIAPFYGIARFYGPRVFVGALFFSAIASWLKPKELEDRQEK